MDIAASQRLRLVPNCSALSKKWVRLLPELIPEVVYAAQADIKTRRYWKEGSINAHYDSEPIRPETASGIGGFEISEEDFSLLLNA